MQALRLFAGVLVLSSCIAAQVAGTPELAALGKTLEAQLRESGAPGMSVAVAQGGKVVYATAFGEANLAGKRAATAETRYAIGSISKEFTAAALLLMQEQGKLSLDDHVAKFFPQYTRANEVTVRQLLSHTAGYEDYAPQDYLIPEWLAPTTADAILEKWATKPLNFDPGTKWQYSNTNYVLAGKIFEKVSGRKLVEFLRATIFTPLGMTTASDCDEKSPEDAAAYTRYALGPPRVVKREASGWYFAAGELCMTASDVARWDIGFLQKRILSPRSYEEFTREVKLANGSGTHYALGLQVGQTEGIPMVSHSGEVSGFLAANEIFPTKNISVTVLSNEDGVNLIFGAARQIALAFLKPDSGTSGSTQDSALNGIRAIVEGLQGGTIDRALFTSNANSYFTDTALNDYKNSLAPLGKLSKVIAGSSSLRGGMNYHAYQLVFDGRKLQVSEFVKMDGKIEQFLIVGGGE